MTERTEIITNCLAGKTLTSKQMQEGGIISIGCGLSSVVISEHFCSSSSFGLPDNLCNERDCKYNKHNPINIDSWS